MEGLLALLKALAVQLQHLARRMSAYQRLCSSPGNNAYHRGKALVEIEKAISALPEGTPKERLSAWFAQERSVVEELKEDFRFRFVKELMAALEGSGMSVKGQLPLLRVGLFTVRVDFDAGTANIFWGPEIERLKSGVRLEPASLARLLRTWKESLDAAAKWSPDEFLRRLHTAYQRFCSSNGLSEGTRVLLTDILAELVLLLQPPSFRANPSRERFVEYPRVRFSYDLYRLKRAGAFQVGPVRLRLHVANFDATVEKTRAIWVPDNEDGEGTHYSYISFTPGG
ncbi:MAG: hypothetical protein ABIK44_05380 [candidate division WOR-3 bacterium]